MADRLLELSEARIEAERREMQAAEAADGAWRSRRLALAARMIAWYVGGLFSIGISWHSTNYEVARYVFVFGLLAGGLGPLFSAYTGWLEENR